MFRYLAACALLALGTTVSADMQTYFTFEGAPGPFSGHLKSVGDGSSFARLRVNTNPASNQAPELVADTPAPLASRSKTALEVNRGLTWIKYLKGGEYTFAPEFSLNFWFKADKAPESTIFLATFNKSWRLGYTPSNNRFYYQNLAAGEKEYSTVVPFPTGSWNMLTVTGKPGQLNFYLNGKAIGRRTLKKALVPSIELFVGNGAAFDKTWFDGRIDDLSLWDNCLDAKTISELYQGMDPTPFLRKKKLPPGVIARTFTKSLGKDFKPYEPVREFALAKDDQPVAAIVKADAGDFVGFEPKLQEALRSAWGVTFPVLTFAEARQAGKPMIFFGRSNGNMGLRRLAGNQQIDHTQKGSEVRVMPQTLDWGVGTVFLGGTNEDEVLQGVKELTERFPQPEAMRFFIRTEGFRNHTAPADFPEQMVKKLEEHYRNPPDYIPNQSAVRLFREPVGLFRQTGDPVYARAFAAMLKGFMAHYDKAQNARNTPPSFTFHEFPWMLSLVEQSDAFTAEDRALAAEICRKVIENCMDYWEMAGPMNAYESQKPEYFTNHPIFASRSVWFAAEYLWRHYRFEPAKYWMAVSEYAMAGIAPHQIGPEDAVGYQYICYRNFITYAIGSGKYDSDFFNTPEFRNYIRYVKSQYSHLGTMAGFGDASPLGNISAFPVLGYAVDLFGDREAESLLALIYRNAPKGVLRSMIRNLGIDGTMPLAMGDDLLGLNVFPMDRFRLELRKAPKFPLPVLDKAFFRNSWDPRDGEFLVLSGISSAPHGHFDVNALALYTRGAHHWLVEGDYIRKNPEEHNTLTIRENGRHVRPKATSSGALAQIRHAGQLPSHKLAATSTLAAKYGGLDWTRDVVFEPDFGLLVLDELTANRPGDFLAECRWRLLGDWAQSDAQSVSLTQRPAEENDRFAALAISEGTGAERQTVSQFDEGHQNKDGYYLSYPHAGPETRVLTQRHQNRLQTGESLRFLNVIGATPQQIRRIGEKAWCITSPDGTVRGIVAGTFRGKDVQVEADRLYFGPRGLIAFGATALRLGPIQWSSAEKQDLFLEADERFPQAAAALAALAGDILPAATPRMPDAPVIAGVAREMPAAVTALTAASGGVFGVGMEDGQFQIVDARGRTQWETRLPGRVSAAAAVPGADGKICWAVAAAPTAERPDNGELYAFDGSGRELWHRTIRQFQSRNGTIKTLFPAHIGGQNALIAGAENWHYYAFSPDGKELWKRQVYHGATVGAARDLDGDGEDEILAGTEYYYHQLLGPDGQVLFQRNTDPWTLALGIADLDGDGKPEGLFGRTDSRIHVMTPLDRGRDSRHKPLQLGGLPVGITGLLAGTQAKFAAATANGDVVFVDGAMQIVATTALPGQLLGMADTGKSLAVQSADGNLYFLGYDGKIIGAGKCGFDPSQSRRALPAVSDGSTAVAAGKTLTIF